MSLASLALDIRVLHYRGCAEPAESEYSVAAVYFRDLAHWRLASPVPDTHLPHCRNCAEAPASQSRRNGWVLLELPGRRSFHQVAVCRTAV